MFDRTPLEISLGSFALPASPPSLASTLFPCWTLSIRERFAACSGAAVSSPLNQQ
jgi:hypothetical protein